MILKHSSKKGFTLLELIMVIVIIGALAAVAVPKFAHLSSNSKVSAELATASTIQAAIDDVHSEWIMSEGSVAWGNAKTEDDLTTEGYPKQLGDCPPAFNWILKASSTVDAKWECSDNGDGTFDYKGPASKAGSGVAASSGDGKPGEGDCWKYDSSKGTFSLDEGCN